MVDEHCCWKSFEWQTYMSLLKGCFFLFFKISLIQFIRTILDTAITILNSSHLGFTDYLYIFTGFGVFATKDFRGGSFLLRYPGYPITENEADAREQQNAKNLKGCFMYYFQPDYKQKTMWYENIQSICISFVCYVMAIYQLNSKNQYPFPKTKLS